MKCFKFSPRCALHVRIAIKSAICQTGASRRFVLVVCCTMLVALTLVTYTFTIQNAGRTQEILFVSPKGTFRETFQRCGVTKPESSGHFHRGGGGNIFDTHLPPHVILQLSLEFKKTRELCERPLTVFSFSDLREQNFHKHDSLCCS
jgi:hypothetical protein